MRRSHKKIEDFIIYHLWIMREMISAICKLYHIPSKVFIRRNEKKLNMKDNCLQNFDFVCSFKAQDKL